MVRFPFGAPATDVRAHIAKHGSLGQNENLRIHDKLFANARARAHLLRQLDRMYGIWSGTVLDAGCSHGQFLALAQPGSYGIERRQHRADFANSIGLTCHRRDLVHDDLSDLPPVDTVLLLSVLEHVENEHRVLRKLTERLRIGGLLIVSVPARLPPAIPYEEHDDHINAYTPATLAFECQRAGTARVRCWRYCNPLLRRAPWLPMRLMATFPLSLIGNAAIYVGRKPDAWEYPEDATRRRADNACGFVAASR